MAVTATVPYGGTTVPGITFRVVEAWRRMKPSIDGKTAEDFLQYDCRVVMPDGITQMQGVGWENVRVDNPDAIIDTGTPLVQAEAAMKSRLTASGATNIVEV